MMDRIPSGFDWSGRKVLVMGLGRFGGGIGAARYLAAKGANVTVTDLADAERLEESVHAIADLNLELHLGEHRREDFQKAELVIASPAVPRDSTWLSMAKKNGALLNSEMNLFVENCPARIVGVTGSNGKSTTTAMIGQVLKCRDKAEVWVGGNIGQGSLLEKIDRISSDDIVVLELSSFQLEDLAVLEKSPEIAVLTNIQPNHLDRHGTMAEYIRAKKIILQFQTKNDWAVLNRQDKELVGWQNEIRGQALWYPSQNPRPIPLRLPGRHNQLNAAAALTVGEILGISREKAIQALSRFQGLPHRLEWVARIQAVDYYNDSIATTPESVLAAIQSFDQEKILILGGYDKKVSFEPLAQAIAGQVHSVILLGQVQSILFETIEKAKQMKGKDRPACYKAADLSEAVRIAYKQAEKEMVVLLSPGCASYDQFVNFQQRGNQFRSLVEALASTSGL